MQLTGLQNEAFGIEIMAKSTAINKLRFIHRMKTARRKENVPSKRIIGRESLYGGTTFLQVANSYLSALR